MKLLDISQVEFSRKDLKKEIKLPDHLSLELAEDIGIHVGDGTMNIYCGSNGKDYYYKLCGNIETEKEWYDEFIIPLKRQLFNLDLCGTDFKDSTYGIQFRSKAIILFYHQIIGIQLGYKAKTVDIPDIIKNSQKEFKIAFLRGIFDTDFSLTFKKKYRGVHYYPVISCDFASENLTKSLCKILTELKFNFSTGTYYSFDNRINKTKIGHKIFISGKKLLNKWFEKIGSHNNNNLTKFDIWKRFGFCPVDISIIQRELILEDKLDPLILEKNGHGRI